MHIDQLDYIVNKYNDTYHRTIKMKPFDVDILDFNEDNNKGRP